MLIASEMRLGRESFFYIVVLTGIAMIVYSEVPSSPLRILRTFPARLRWSRDPRVSRASAENSPSGSSSHGDHKLLLT